MPPLWSVVGLLRPVAPFLASLLVYAVAMRPQRPSRPWIVPMALLHFLSLRGASAWPRDGVDSLWGLMICIWASHSTSMLYLEDQTTLLIDGRGPLASLHWTTKFATTWNNTRLLGTSRAERGAKRHSLISSHSRSLFAILCVAQLAAYWILHKHVVPRLLLPGPFMPLSLDDFAPERQAFFRRLLPGSPSIPSLREAGLRLSFSVFWAVEAYIMVDGAHVALALFFVSVARTEQPGDWGPIYGSPSSIRGLRSFWGRFWHRVVVIPYGNVGRLLCRRLLPGLPESGYAAKAVVALCIFFLSGASHGLAAWNLDGPNSLWYLDIWWFCLNFVGCALEGVVASWLSGLTRRQGARRSTLAAWLGRAWLLVFFFWSVPKWQYPKVHALIVHMARQQM